MLDVLTFAIKVVAAGFPDYFVQSHSGGVALFGKNMSSRREEGAPTSWAEREEID